MSRHHELMGISPGASDDELKAAYRELVKVWHPDRFAHDAQLQKKAEQKLQEINHAFKELSKTPERLPDPSPPIPSMAQAAPVSPSGQGSRGGGPRLILVAMALIALPLGYWGLRSVLSQRTIDPKALEQGAGWFYTGTRRYLLSDPMKNEFYIIEGPRVPEDWEIKALVSAYRSHSPRAKQSVGQFAISQTMKPGDNTLTPLRSRSLEHDV